MGAGGSWIGVRLFFGFQNIMQIMNPAAVPRPGELWEFPIGTEGLVGWVAVKFHPDDESLLLMVPADTEAFVGPLDVAVALVEAGSAGHRRVVLRGSFARWVPAKAFWFKVEGASVARAWRAELCERLVAGGVDIAAVELAGEAVAFEDGVLAPAATELEAWTERKERAVRVDLTGPSDAGVDFVAGPELLAAAGESALDAIFADADEAAPVAEVLRKLEGVFAGHEVELRVTPFEVQLEAAGGDMPPACFFLGPRGGRVFLSWVRHISGTWRSQPARLDELEAPPLRLVIAGSRGGGRTEVVDLELDFDPLAGGGA